MKTCGICRSKKRAEIDAALVAGSQSIRDITRHFKIKRAALYRHKPHIAKALVQVKEAADAAEATTLYGRVEQQVAKAKEICDKALGKDEFSSAIRALAEVRACLELLAEISGELKRGSDLNLNVFSGDLTPADKLAVENNRKLVAMSDEELDAREAAFRRTIEAENERNRAALAELDGTTRNENVN